MYLVRREAPESIFMKIEYELNKEYVLGPSVSIFIHFRKELNKEYVLVERGASSEYFHLF